MGDGPPALTVAELAAWLDPPFTPARVEALLAAFGIRPVTTRARDRAGRPPRAYPAAAVQRAHAIAVRFEAENTGNAAPAGKP